METAAATPADEIALLRRQLAEREAALEVAHAQIEALTFQLAVLRRRQFGQSSEKLDAEIAQLELRLEDLEESQAEQHAQRPPPGSRSNTSRKPAIRKPLPSHLPREIVVHEPEIICVCQGWDRSKLTRLGEDVTEVLEKIPARLKVIRHVRPRYACRKCEGVFQAPVPELPIERGRPGPGLIANVAVSKFCDGLPLYRQSVILEREGIEIDRATLADWLGHAAWWLAPLAVRIGQYVMGLPVIHTDDTTIKVLAPGLGKTRTARIWVYAADPRIWADAVPPAAFYRYSPVRTAMARDRASISPDSAGSCTPTPMPAMARCTAHAAISHRGWCMLPVLPMRAASSSRCMTQPNRRLPRKLFAASRRSTKSRPISPASPRRHDWPLDALAASRCSTHSKPGPINNAVVSPARRRWARPFDTRSTAGRR